MKITHLLRSALLAVVITTASHAALNLVSANRYVSVTPGPFLNTSTVGGAYDETVADPADNATASQQSDIATLQITGAGLATVDTFGLAPYLADTQFIAQFSLDAPHGYTIAGDLFTDFEVGSGLAALTFTGTGLPTISQSGSAFGPITGTIGPGLYSLSARALAAASANNSGLGAAGFDFTLTLRPLEVAAPEPATLALLALAAPLLTIRRRAL